MSNTNPNKNRVNIRFFGRVGVPDLLVTSVVLLLNDRNISISSNLIIYKQTTRLFSSIPEPSFHLLDIWFAKSFLLWLCIIFYSIINSINQYFVYCHRLWKAWNRFYQFPNCYVYFFFRLRQFFPYKVTMISTSQMTIYKLYWPEFRSVFSF